MRIKLVWERGVQNFIVLGLVPGTQLQITFLAWLILSAGLLFAVVVWIIHRLHLVRNWLIAIITSAAIRRRHLSA